MPPLLGVLDGTCLSWFLAVAAVFGTYIIWSRTFWTRRGVPQDLLCTVYMSILQTWPWGLLGDFYEALILRRSVGSIATDIYRRFDGKPFVGVYKFLTPVLLVRDADLIKEVLVQNFASFQTNEAVFPADAEGVFSDNPFVADPERWKGLRTKLSQLFTPSRVRGTLPDMAESASRLVDFLEAGGPDTSYEGNTVVKRFTAHSSLRNLFGIESHSLDIGSEPGVFYEMGHKIFNNGFLAVLRFMAFAHCPGLLKFVGYDFVSHDTRDFFRKLLRDCVEYRSKENIARDDLVQHIAKQITVDGKIDDAALETSTYQAINTYVETFETSGVVITAVLLMLATHPSKQDKVREELRAKVPAGKPLDENVVASLTYLEQAIKETMRLHPPLDMSRRKCTKATTLRDPSGSGADVKLQPGDIVYVPVQAIHRDAAFYARPDEYYPEHFDEEEVAGRHKVAFMGFGEGPRQCPGMRYGMQQMKVVLATLLRRFEVTTGPEQVLPPERDPAAAILGFRGGAWFRFHPVS